MQIPNTIERITIVTGCQRSGTTLTGQILGAHPKAFLIDETDELYQWFRGYSTNAHDAGELWAKASAAADRKYQPSFKRNLAGASAAGASTKTLTHLILKAPNLTFEYDVLARLDMPVSIIFPVRDPRSVVVSMSKLSHVPMVENQLSLLRDKPELLVRFAGEIQQLNDPALPAHVKRALIWRIKSVMFRDFQAAGLPTFQFRYEDLVANTAEMCRRMTDHVGLDFDEQILSHEQAYIGFGPGFNERTRPVDNLSLARWSDRLSPGQESEVIEVTHQEMLELGYVRSPAAPAVNRMTHIPEETLLSPIIFSGRGGSGTRLLSELALASGVFLGNRLNRSKDSTEWVDLFYEMAIGHTREKNGSNGQESKDWQKLLMARAQDVLAQGKWKHGQSWGWKLPESMLLVPQLFEVFTHAKFVHLVRHPVDSSLRRTHMTSRNDNPVGRVVLNAAYETLGFSPLKIRDDKEHVHNAISWLYQVGMVTDFARRQLSAKQYLEIKYEDVCENPDAALSRLAEFIGFHGDLQPVAGVEFDRVRIFALDDPRIDEVWKLCAETAQKLAYKPVA